jgi:NADH-quinone oxidoreductase subunit J
VIGLGIFIVFAALLVKTLQPGWYGKPSVPPPTTVEIGNAIFTTFVFPFEVISLVLLAAMIGAIFIAKKEGPS